MKIFMEKVNNIITFILSLVFISSCISNEDKYNIEVGDSIYDIYENYSNEKVCKFSNFIFIDCDNKNYVIELNDDNEVKNYQVNRSADFKNSKFNNVDDMTIYEVIEKIGIPSFCGESNNKQILYYKKDPFIHYVIFDDINETVIEHYSPLIIDELPLFFYEPDKKEKPDDKLVDKIYNGMDFEDLLFILGRPEKDIGFGAIILEFELKSGKKLKVNLCDDEERKEKQKKKLSFYPIDYYYYYEINTFSVE